jgi:hypothetical protein
MYKAVSVRAAEIRKKLKAIGYNSHMVSVRSSQFSGGDNIVIRMKSVDVDEHKVREIAKGYEDIARDKYNGEILMGSNLFVFVEWDWQFVEKAKERWYDLAKAIYEKPYISLDNFHWIKDSRVLSVHDKYGVRHQFRAGIDGIADALLYAIEIYRTVKEDELK